MMVLPATFQDQGEETTMSRTARGIAAVAAVAVSVLGSVTGPAVAGGDYGPDTCLQGWVWREAFPGDHVCVSGPTRSQAWADNAAAASRRNPAGGPYGPDTCLVGWVWREAQPSDHVCVTPTIRQQTSIDNATAAARRASLNVTVGKWYPGPQCDGDVCTSTSTDDIPRFRISGDHFNVGSVTVRIARTPGNHVLWQRTIQTAANSWTVDADVIDCSFGPSKPANAYAQAYDYGSSRWSAQIPVRTGCSVL
jgi:hypothetical protein